MRQFNCPDPFQQRKPLPLLLHDGIATQFACCGNTGNLQLRPVLDIAGEKPVASGMSENLAVRTKLHKAVITIAWAPLGASKRAGASLAKSRRDSQ